ncbi:MAG: ACR3 family arsenite efflux transporter [Candidatus Helarchaeota archaeon]|nr:ACR3 family arsenite efflux transporter [Candidatus Helarchaeota archaeon]
METEIKVAEHEIEEEGKGLGTFEKFLFVWVAICIGIGILLSQTVPGIGEAIDSLSIGQISIPIGICLFLMMYPAMLNLQTSELKKLGKDPKPVILTLISNWGVAPFVGAGLAAVFLQGNEQLIVAVILLAASPCTAMVLIWGYLAEGNQEQNFITTSINTITIIFGYVGLVGLLIGLVGLITGTPITIDWIYLLISAGIFIGLPLVMGIISKKVIVQRKGEDWFEKVYRPFVGKVAIVALLTTLIVLFSLNGKVLIERPDLLLLVSIPLLLGFVIVVSYNLFTTKLLKLKYKEAIITVIIGSSSHFEIAIATATVLYGVGSIGALGTTMGLFWEVPIMLGLVYLGKYLRRKNFWKTNNSP